MGQSESFTYDANGNRLSHTDFNGATHSYEYDINNRVKQIDYADGRIESYQYDANGNRTQSSIANGGLTRIWVYQYDNLNRLKQETKPNGSTLVYSYDATGNKTQLVTTPANGSAKTTTYAYDKLNRLSSVTDSSGTTGYGYDAVGNRTSISYPNNTSQTYTYDTLNRLTKLDTFDGNGALVKSYSYTLHPTGRRTQIDETGGRSTAYSYDTLYRLTDENITDVLNGNHNASYSYDKTGNRTQSIINGITTAYTYDANDRLTQTGGTTYSYDANGNTLSESLDGNTTTYTYNSKNHLSSTTKAGAVTSYRYNPDGIRHQQNDIATTKDYLVDQNRDYAQVLVELDNSTEAVSYSYGDDLISQTRNGASYFYHYDGLGSTRALSDSSGVLTDSYDYEAFGGVLSQTGTTENSYLFTGEQFDAGLDQYYLRARYYDQGVGRFTQQDTYMGNSADPMSLHKYLYANGDPANMVDPTGNFSIGSVVSGARVHASLISSASLRLINPQTVRLLAGGVRSSADRAMKFIVKKCINNRKKCPIDVSIVVIGHNHPNQLKHVADAISGNGENLGGPLSPVLHYQKTGINRKSWPKNRSPRGLNNSCNNRDKMMAESRFGTRVACDEYPFSLSKQSGYRNYRSGRVSLRFIPHSENSAFGSTMSGLGRGRDGLKNGDKFVVVPAAFSPVSITIKGSRRR